MPNGTIQQAASIAVQLGLIVALVAAAGFMLVTNPDHDLTNLLAGAVVADSGLIISKLFGGTNGS